jgi:hypothetical protein
VAISRRAAAEFVERMRETWVEHGGERISLPPEVRATVLKTLLRRR